MRKEELHAARQVFESVGLRNLVKYLPALVKSQGELTPETFPFFMEFFPHMFSLDLYKSIAETREERRKAEDLFQELGRFNYQVLEMFKSKEVPKELASKGLLSWRVHAKGLNVEGYFFEINYAPSIVRDPNTPYPESTQLDVGSVLIDFAKSGLSQKVIDERIGKINSWWEKEKRELLGPEFRHLYVSYSPRQNFFGLSIGCYNPSSEDVFTYPGLMLVTVPVVANQVKKIFPDVDPEAFWFDLSSEPKDYGLEIQSLL